MSINVVTSTAGDQHNAVSFLRGIVKRNIVMWNDDPRRTKRQVLAAFTKAQKLAERMERRKP